MAGQSLLRLKTDQSTNTRWARSDGNKVSFYEAEADVKRAGTLQFLILSCFTAIGLMWRLFIIEFTMNKYNHRLRSTGQQLQGSRMAVSTTQYQIQIPHQERWPIVFGGGFGTSLAWGDMLADPHSLR